MASSGCSPDGSASRRDFDGDADGDEIHGAILDAGLDVVADADVAEQLKVVDAPETLFEVERAVGREHESTGRGAGDVVLKLVETVVLAHRAPSG